MIFVSGVHGVGKSHFCDVVKTTLGFATFLASDLISERKNAGYPADKRIHDIDDNQSYLISAVNELNAKDPFYLLDGHFCLLNEEGKVTRIPKETFISLKPDAIVLLTESPEVIAMRRKQRDNIECDINKIQHFQKEEIAYATEIANILGVPLKVSTGENDLDNTLDYIGTNMRRLGNGR